jgi:predicted dehydrogenase
MKKQLIFLVIATLFMVSCTSNKTREAKATESVGEVKYITLDPGHFHAALIQKSSYEQVSNDVYVYAPEGDDLNEHLKKIEAYNKRAESPTSWNEIVYTGNDFLEKMLKEKKGNVMITAGNNRKKTEYIKKTLEAGINVLSDKPMAINEANFDTLKECFDIAKKNKLLLYDIMTERFEITTILQRELSRIPSIYGEQETGTTDNPAIVMESVHHFFKTVSGNPLIRPAWSYDVEQQGEGIVDVMTHLVDLVQWECFPGKAIDYVNDIKISDASHWTTSLSNEQFERSTGLKEYPPFLLKYVSGDSLRIYSNGEINYQLKGLYVKLIAKWNYEAPEGGGDTHHSILRGTKANLVIRQGKEQNYRPTLYIEPVDIKNIKNYEETVTKEFTALAGKYPGVDLKKTNSGWEVLIPEKYNVGHEAHFEQVAKNFLQYLADGKLPDWEVPNMIAKYYTTTSALTIAKK